MRSVKRIVCCIMIQIGSNIESKLEANESLVYIAIRLMYAARIPSVVVQRSESVFFRIMMAL